VSKPYVLANEITNTLAVAYVRGTDNHVHLTSATGFPTGGGYIRIGDSTSFCLCEYTAVSTNDLTTVTACTLGVVVSVGDEAKTWPIGTVVSRIWVAEEAAELITGPASATDGHLAVFDGTSGKKAKDGGAPYTHPNHSGNVTSAGDGATTIAAAAVTLAMQANLAQDTIISRVSTGAGVPEAVTVAEQTLLGRITGGHVDDLSAAQARTLLNVADGANAYTHPNHSGNVTSAGDGATTIAAAAVTLAMQANLAAESIIANNTGSAATPAALAVAEQRVVGRITGGHITDLTAAQTKTLLGITKHYLRGTVAKPKDFYDNVDHEICLWPATDAAITITKIQITCDADPTTELDIDLKWSDAFIGLGNAAVIDVCDTAAGVVVITTGFDDATVASGKCIYWSFGAAPDAATTQFSFSIEYTYD